MGSGTEKTWEIGELLDAVAGLVEHRFGGRTWVTGELRSLSRSPAGHRYFELVEPGTDGDHGSARLAVTLFDSQRQRVNAKVIRAGNKVQIAEGTELRICGQLRTYAPQSRIQLNMTDIDPAYTLGVISQRRELALAALTAAGLTELNGSLSLAEPAIRVGLVTSRSSAAAADVLDEIQSSTVGFEVLCIDARTQGRDAELSLVAALRTAEELRVDVVLLVRGGGSSSDLSVFDSETLGRAIARLSVPVFTGIGHETDHSVADVVAHSSHKTPTAAAAAIVRSAEAVEHRLASLTASISSAAEGAALRAAASLQSRARAATVAARRHVAHEEQLLGVRLERVATAAPRALDAARALTDDLASRAASASRLRVERAQQVVDRQAELVAARDPARMMELGWSVAHGASGELIRRAGDVAPGDSIRTTVAGGTVVSEVTAIEADDATSIDARNGRGSR